MANIELIGKIVPKNDAFTGLVDGKQIIGGETNKIPAEALDIVNDFSGGATKLLSAERGKELDTRLSATESGDLGTIAYNAAAPTPDISGIYSFSTAGVVSWLPGTPSVKVGDRVSVKYTAPSTYVYTFLPRYVDLSDAINSDSSTVGASSKAVKMLNDAIIAPGGVFAHKSDYIVELIDSFYRSIFQINNDGTVNTKINGSVQNLSTFLISLLNTNNNQTTDISSMKDEVTRLSRGLFTVKSDNLIEVYDAFYRPYLQLTKTGSLYVRVNGNLIPITESSTKPDISYYNPGFVLGIDKGTNDSGIEMLTKIYPESFVGAKDATLNLNGSRCIGLQNNKSTNAEQITDTVTFQQSIKLKSDNYNTIDDNVNYIKVKRQVAKNKKVRLLVIADSIGAQVEKMPDGSIPNGGWAYPSLIQSLSIIDDIETSGNINLVTIGTCDYSGGNGPGNRTMTHNGITRSMRSFHECHGGWATHTFLNFPFFLRASFNWSGTYYMLGLATRTPFDSQTAGQTFTPFDGSNAHKHLCEQTPFGRYKPDYGSSDSEYSSTLQLWELLKTQSTWTGFSGTGTYTGSSDQKSVMDSFFDRMVSDCGKIILSSNNQYNFHRNPFYSIDKARAYTGQHVWANDNAFDLQLYLNRFRTMDDNGNRLYFDSNGSTTGTPGSGNIGYLSNGTQTSFYIGTGISDTNWCNVCKPTHIINGLGTNDLGLDYTTDNTNRFYPTTIIKRELESFDSNAKIGFMIPRAASVFNKAKWIDISFAIEGDVRGYAFQHMKDLITAVGSGIDKNRQSNYIPVYQTMSCLCGGWFGRQILDYDNQDFKIMCSSYDSVHPGWYTHLSIAYQCLAWVYYTLSN